MKRTVSAILVMAVAMASLQGCYGKMALTRKVYQINGEVKDKYLRSLVTWAFVLVPVYGVSALCDFVLFNTIEFWSGHNPVAQGEKSFQYAEAGKTYRIDAKKSGDTVTYVINRYEGSRYLDTLSINWDTKSGNSTARMSAASGVTDFAAVRENGAVQVTSSAPIISGSQKETVALYR